MLELVWVNPSVPPELPHAAPAALTLVPPAPRRTSRPRVNRPRVDLAKAIEAHLTGGDGLSDGDFVTLFATGTLPAASV